MSDQVSEFMTDTLPMFTAIPEWRELFNTFSGISEHARKTLLARPLPKDLEEELDAGQLEALTAFMRANLEDNRFPRMIAKVIDWESRRQKLC